MIKFFRQIRYQLLGEGKTGKYLKYAIGEIVLVVIGILIALSINNWNEDRKQQRIVKIYLSNYIEDLKDDISNYKNRTNQAIFKFHSLQHLLSLVGEVPVKLHENEYINPLTSDNTLWNKPLPFEPNRAFFELSFLWSIRDVAPVVNRTSIKELNSTGTFSFIENPDLKDAINDYYSQIDWRFGADTDAYQIRIGNNWQESLLRSGILAQDISRVENPLNLLRNNTERIGYLREVIRGTWFRAYSLDVLEKKASELIGLIEAELSNQ